MPSFFTCKEGNHGLHAKRNQFQVLSKIRRVKPATSTDSKNRYAPGLKIALNTTRTSDGVAMLCLPLRASLDVRLVTDLSNFHGGTPCCHRPQEFKMGTFTTSQNAGGW